MELPGFYYDAERRRYFRITNTGNASAQGMAAYSTSSVESQRRKRARTAANDKQVHSNKPSPPSFTVNQLRLMEPLGSFGPLGGRLESRAEATLKSKLRLRAERELESGSSPTTMTGGDENGLFVGFSCGTLKYVPANGQQSDVLIDKKGSAISGLNYGGGGILSGTTLGSHEGSGTVNVWLLDEISMSSGQLFTPSRPETFWSSHCSGDKSLLVAGGVGKVWLFDMARAGLDYDRVVKIGSKSDVLAVASCGDFHGFDRNEVVCGTRPGKVMHLDIRDRSKPSSWSHGSGVTHVQHVTNIGNAGKYIVVSGFQDRCGVYDTRFTSKMVAQYPQYRNYSTAAHGFSISDPVMDQPSSANRYAAIGCDDKVRIYEALTGALITSIESKSSVAHWSGTPSWPFKSLYLASDNLSVYSTTTN